MFCNEQPRSRIPVLLIGDVWPICLIITTGLTNGYFVSLGVIHGPSYVTSERKECAGIAMGIYMALGLSFGVAFSFALVASL
ncbi:unnamed protein product [Rodentolepis nana]|uniref:Monocarboxylate transporter 14 n=1 Tax=Rodentolepis nana TaxID=102285 RepID=A0A0R3TH08_RODNA|nr:unnamed protein product [Rodentolepis nana]